MTRPRPAASCLFALCLLGAPLRAGPLPQAEVDKRVRLRELGVRIGPYETGPLNAITDVAGVKVGHTTIVRGSGKLVPEQGPARTGVTAIIPRDDVWHRKCFAGSFVENGNGELTGLHWVSESGWLETPIVLTDTLSVGRADDAVVSWMIKRVPEMGISDDVILPVVGECDDSLLNDQRGRHVHERDVLDALEHAASGPVAEGAVGAGTGMVAYEFKAGIGTSSRHLPASLGGYTVGVLVNANMGTRRDLRIDGVPVGAEIPDLLPTRKPGEGSIIIIVATDAPLLPHQLNRVAKRAVVGLARTGTPVHHGSGDFALAFSTATVVPHVPRERPLQVSALSDGKLDPLFEATEDSTEEAIGNALTMARTTTGRDGNTAYALPLARMRSVLRRHGQLR